MLEFNVKRSLFSGNGKWKKKINNLNVVKGASASGQVSNIIKLR